MFPRARIARCGISAGKAEHEFLPCAADLRVAQRSATKRPALQISFVFAERPAIPSTPAEVQKKSYPFKNARTSNAEFTNENRRPLSDVALQCHLEFHFYRLIEDIERAEPVLFERGENCLLHLGGAIAG